MIYKNTNIISVENYFTIGGKDLVKYHKKDYEKEAKDLVDLCKTIDLKLYRITPAGTNGYRAYLFIPEHDVGGKINHKKLQSLVTLAGGTVYQNDWFILGTFRTKEEYLLQERHNETS